MSSKDGKESDFFNRWSDRKTAERDDQSQEQVEIPEQAAVALSSGQEETSDENLPVPDDLPDIKTLDKNSDFSLFMREGTPKKLKRLALRKLFTSDPIFAGLDGLNDYDEDYSMIGMVAEVVSTRYKPGQGMVDPEEKILAKEPEEKISVKEEAKNIPDDGSSKEGDKQDDLSNQEGGEELSEDLIEDAEMP
ncbi:MAG TPA: DUF3306 domain-containing protein [Rhodospirillales bacterium]|nr:DUF3306 domain-containing protein [Rhodospirillales bacterium]HIL74993.1 DUF3306 domain-containing protein [Rhodospirillales bacterium]